MTKLLTISIAAYNMEQYIGETLDSLIDERVIDQLEVFVVDDGGKDRTLDIAREYAEKYPDSIFPVHKENGGYGSTVNYSIAHATGKYFKLLDGDDWFDKDGLYHLVEALRETDTDVIITPRYKGPDKENLTRSGTHGLQNGIKNKIKDVRISGFIGMWEITYRTEILKASGVELPEHTLYTDQIYATVPFSIAETLQFLDQGVYCYRVGRDGQSVSREARIKHTQEMLDVCQWLCGFYEEQKQRGCENLAYLLYRVTRYYVTAVKTLLLPGVSKEGLAKIKQYEEQTKHLSKDIYEESGKYGNTGKLLTIFRKTNYLPYWLLRFLPGGFPNWT